MRKRLFYLSLLAAAVLITTSTAVTIYTLHYPHEATVTKNPELTTYLDGELWANGTKINWGSLEPGWDYSKNLTVVNTGNTALRVILRVQGLPQGWSLTWAANNTLLAPTGQARGNMILSVPESATNGTYTWNSWIEGS